MSKLKMKNLIIPFAAAILAQATMALNMSSELDNALELYDIDDIAEGDFMFAAIERRGGGRSGGGRGRGGGGRGGGGRGGGGRGGGGRGRSPKPTCAEKAERLAADFCEENDTACAAEVAAICDQEDDCLRKAEMKQWIETQICEESDDPAQCVIDVDASYDEAVAFCELDCEGKAEFWRDKRLDKCNGEESCEEYVGEKYTERVEWCTATCDEVKEKKCGRIRKEEKKAACEARVEATAEQCAAEPVE